MTMVSSYTSTETSMKQGQWELESFIDRGTTSNIHNYALVPHQKWMIFIEH
jgi:hypothetical protein